MNTIAKRNLLGEAAIAILVAASAQYFVAQPIMNALTQTDDQVRAASAAITQNSVALDASAIERLLADLRSTSAWVDEQNTSAANPAYMLDSLNRLASQTGVRVEHIRPLETQRLSSPPPVAGPPDAPSDPGTLNTAPWTDTRAACDITVTGPFDSVIRFLDSLRTGFGFTNIAGVRLAPTPLPGAETVIAEIQLQQYQFDTHSIRSAMSVSNAAEAGAGGTNK